MSAAASFWEQIMNDDLPIHEGGCTCGQLRYQVSGDPMVVHCCHCGGCQQNSGSAFALNALYETDRVHVTSGKVETFDVPTPSGKGQTIARCASCRVAVWSNYNMGGLREAIRFIRVGTLDAPNRCPPDVHIYTVSKQNWVIIPPKDKQVEKFYRWTDVWTETSMARLHVLEKKNGIKIT
jgi:hypothetical protein